MNDRIRKNSGNDWKRRATRFLALFLLLYVAADISVLQQYCGNEVVGIPPASQSSLNAGGAGKTDGYTGIADASADLQSYSSTERNVPCQAGECLCCCPHVIFGDVSVVPPPKSEVEVTNLVPPSRRPYVHSSTTVLFRPPRLA